MTLAADRPTTDAPTVEDLLLHHRVEQFLVRLQNAIDDHRYIAWLDMFVPEGVYAVIDQLNKNGHGMYLTYDDGLEARKQRVAYLMGYWKVPRARTLHTVTNVLVTFAGDDRVEARSKFTVYRTDREGYTKFHASGEYFDEFDRSDGGLLFRRHGVVIDMNVLPDDFTELL